MRVDDWSGDYATAKARAAEAGVELNLAYSVPKTGSGAWFDIWCIPSDAAHNGMRTRFINYMMDPEVIAKCTNFTNYANANLAARQVHRQGGSRRSGGLSERRHHEEVCGRRKRSQDL